MLTDKVQLDWFMKLLDKSNDVNDQELIKGFKIYMADINVVHCDGNNIYHYLNINGNKNISS